MDGIQNLVAQNDYTMIGVSSLYFWELVFETIRYMDRKILGRVGKVRE